MSFCLPRFQNLTYYLLPLIFFLLGPYSVTDSTLWITWGRLIIEQGSVYTRDSISVLDTEPLIFASWLPSLLYYGIEKYLGLRALMHFHHLLIFPLFAIIYKFTPIENFKGSKRWVLYFTWLGMIPALNERPAFIALILLALFYNLFDYEIWNKKRIIILSLVMLLWTNVHGTFVLMPLMVFWRAIIEFFGVEKKNSVKTFALAIWFSLLGLMNPFSYKIYPYVYNTMMYSRERGITEWGNYQFIGHFPQLQLWIFLCSISLFWIIKNLKKQSNQKIIADPFILLLLVGCTGIRNTIFPFIILLNFLSRHSLVDMHVSGDSDSKANYLPTLFLIILLVSVLPPFKKWMAVFLPEKNRSTYEGNAIFEIAKEINEANSRCAVFNDWSYGAFLSYALLRNKIFIDGRNTVYAQKDFQEYRDALQGRNLENYFARYRPCWAVLDQVENSGLVARLKRDGASEVLVENKAVLLNLKY